MRMSAYLIHFARDTASPLGKDRYELAEDLCWRPLRLIGGRKVVVTLHGDLQKQERSLALRCLALFASIIFCPFVLLGAAIGAILFKCEPKTSSHQQMLQLWAQLQKRPSRSDEAPEEEIPEAMKEHSFLPPLKERLQIEEDSFERSSHSSKASSRSSAWKEFCESTDGQKLIRRSSLPTQKEGAISSPPSLTPLATLSGDLLSDQQWLSHAFGIKQEKVAACIDARNWPLLLALLLYRKGARCHSFTLPSTPVVLQLRCDARIAVNVILTGVALLKGLIPKELKIATQNYVGMDEEWRMVTHYGMELVAHLDHFQQESWQAWWADSSGDHQEEWQRHASEQLSFETQQAIKSLLQQDSCQGLHRHYGAYSHLLEELHFCERPLFLLLFLATTASEEILENIQWSLQGGERGVLGNAYLHRLYAMLQKIPTSPRTFGEDDFVVF